MSDDGAVTSLQTVTGNASAPRSTAAAGLGPTLGRYRIERVLGTGAMGVVHAAFDPDLERWIALKILPAAAVTRFASERLLREARAMARLAHPNVLTVHEVGTADGRDFVAMEMIDGETLAEWLRATRRPAAAILEAFVAAGRGLAAAHAAGIVHRDFKPHNVMRRRDGRIAVTDFGLAHDTDDALPPVSEDAAEPDSVSLTGTGALLGTPPYMAPEQWNAGAITPACDQFAYCVALWEALAGERPFRGATLDELRDRISRGPAGLDASRIPRRLRGILRRGLDPDPARRWPDMATLLARLAPEPRGGHIAIAIASVLVLAALVIAPLAPIRNALRTQVCEVPGGEVSGATPAVLTAEADRSLAPDPAPVEAAALLRAAWRRVEAFGDSLAAALRDDLAAPPTATGGFFED